MGVPLGAMAMNRLSNAVPPAYARYVAEAWLRSVRDAVVGLGVGPRTAVSAVG
jgi:hypothetical protein